MMRYDLAAIIRRTRNPRRSSIVIRDIAPPATLATDLYRLAYLPVVQTWERGQLRILSEYERTIAELTTDSAADVEREIGSVATEISAMLLTLTPRLRDWAIRVERWQRGKWRGAVLSATGVDLHTMLGPEDARQTLEQAIAWNASLVRDVSDQARQRIGNAVFAGLNERKPARDVAKEIREAVAMSRRRSIAIASDQLSKVTSSLADERRREAGISTWRWRHSGKLHPRPEHQARDGKVYADTKAGADATRNILPPPADRPGQLPYCGCRAQAVITFD